MSQIVPESELPVQISPFEAVELAYPAELTRTHEALKRRLPVLIECDKELVPYFYKSLRDRLKRDDVRCVYLDGRPPADSSGPQGMVPNLLTQIRDSVRSVVDDKVVVLPHLDLLTSSSGGLTSEAREVIGLLYENPNLVWVGFKDPSFSMPQVIENLFPHHESIAGVERGRLASLVTQREARKFGEGLPLYGLYKYLSGTNAVRLRRLLSSIEGEDYPADPAPAYAQLRSGTLSGDLAVPELSLTDDIGGYAKVKDRLQREILDILAYKDGLSTEVEVRRVEALVPRGMIFWGPRAPGRPCSPRPWPPAWALR